VSTDGTIRKLERELKRAGLLVPFLETVIPELNEEGICQVAKAVHDRVTKDRTPFSITSQSGVVAGETLRASMPLPVNEGGQTWFHCWSMASTGQVEDVKVRLIDPGHDRVILDGEPLSLFSPRAPLIHSFRPYTSIQLEFTNLGLSFARLSVTFEGFQYDGEQAAKPINVIYDAGHP
jgi:hypothetical protein